MKFTLPSSKKLRHSQKLFLDAIALDNENNAIVVCEWMREAKVDNGWRRGWGLAQIDWLAEFNSRRIAKISRAPICPIRDIRINFPIDETEEEDGVAKRKKKRKTKAACREDTRNQFKRWCIKFAYIWTYPGALHKMHETGTGRNRHSALPQWCRSDRPCLPTLLHFLLNCLGFYW